MQIDKTDIVQEFWVGGNGGGERDVAGIIKQVDIVTGDCAAGPVNAAAGRGCIGSYDGIADVNGGCRVNAKTAAGRVGAVTNHSVVPAIQPAKRIKSAAITVGSIGVNHVVLSRGRSRPAGQDTATQIRRIMVNVVAFQESGGVIVHIDATTPACARSGGVVVDVVKEDLGLSAAKIDKNAAAAGGAVVVNFAVLNNAGSAGIDKQTTAGSGGVVVINPAVVNGELTVFDIDAAAKLHTAAAVYMKAV
ncbi:MAG: hypothetical protein BroJett015_01950 [Chloroflexota bacterium]|nr:MAG: hypothetical protein BroJett015_01950 [Chloroflexota bacterium]